MDLQFEWDDEKARINFRKHGVTFKTARRVFEDPNRLDFPDELHSVDEKRYITIGLVKDVLFVVYTERAPKIRLISARKATKDERRDYYDNGLF